MKNFTCFFILLILTFNAHSQEISFQEINNWIDENPPATELEANIVNIDIEGTVATVRLESSNWSGHQFTDMFTLLKLNNNWKIMNKVFHLHS